MVVRRRLIFWLVRAYLAKWGKTIFFSFLAGLAVFFFIVFSSSHFVGMIPIYRHSIVGVTGAYTTDDLPDFIVKKVSQGLTEVNEKGEIKPAIAENWEIQDSGKTYIFHLKKDQHFTNGKQITSDLINYNFSDVKVEKPDKYTIIFKLKDEYSPFLVTVSRPIYNGGFTGSGEYKIDDVKLNGNFIQSLSLVSMKNKFDVRTYEFYPSNESLKYAYVLGEINEAVGLNDISYKNTSYDKFARTQVDKKINYRRLVTLFYNNNDQHLSDKKIRLALSYALPTSYDAGEKGFLPYSPVSIFYNHDLEQKGQNLEHAKLLLDAATTSSESAQTSKELKLTIKTLAKYKAIANQVADSFAKIGIKTTIEEVDRVPSDFQIYLGDFSLSEDPDQYLLWHSAQPNNITKYKNLRIDKLLEDGRKTVDINERKKIYADFQRFLTDDVPASFLFFPMEYVIKRG